MSFERFLDECNINAHTRKNYVGAYKRVNPEQHSDLAKRFKQLEDTHAFATVQFDKRVMKAFFRWRGENDRVDWIKVRQYDVGKEVMNSILSDGEMAALIDACDHPRDKAMLLVAWETGVRLGELLGMQLSHGERTSYGWKWLVRGKTGTRPIWLIRSAPSVNLWLSVHPERKNKTAPLWLIRLKTRVGGIRESRARTILKRSAERAGLSRRVWWHMFRHNAVSRDARRGMAEAALRKKYGWTQHSRMPTLYVHLFGTDVENIVLGMEGVEEVKQKVEDVFMKPKTCFGCGSTNPGDAVHCLKCGLILDEEEVEKTIREDSRLKNRVDKLENEVAEMLRGLAKMKKQ